jgi:fructose-1,6-bisphosphatase/inositol monophosphatase family enzyme
MNLAYVAESRLGGCLSKANKLWDVAAGLVLAQLSGARVEWWPVSEDGLMVSYIAAAPSAWDYLVEQSAGTIDVPTAVGR